MHNFARLIAVVAFGAAGAASAGAALAQDMTVNGTTITVGGGGQYLSLPDIKFTGVGSPGSFHRQTNDNFSNYGGVGSGAIETGLGYWGGYRVTGAVKGFFANMDDDQRSNCAAGGLRCLVIDPTGTFAAGAPSLATHTSRDVDYWGGAAEVKLWSGQPVEVRPNLLRNDYMIVGADVRGIDQNNDLNGHSGGTSVFKYQEDLNTTYYGGYIGFGGEYSFGFLGVGGLWERLGLRSYYSARAGLYDANTDYNGKFAFGFTPIGSKLSISDDELAFIGSVSFETRKQLGPRTSLSLWTDYEYISSVPKLRYADIGGSTRLNDEGAFATRTMLRLNIALGAAPAPYSEPLSAEPLK